MNKLALLATLQEEIHNHKHDTNPQLLKIKIK